MKFRKVVTASAGSLILAVTGCSGGSAGPSAAQGGGDPSQPAKAGGHLVVALSGATDTLDPAFTQSKYSTFMLPNLCEKLYDVDPQLNVIPGLAAALPTVSADGLTYTIKLRQGLKFNDGTPFDAAAVKVNMDRFRTNPRSAEAANWTSVKQVTVVDPNTVTILLSKPDAVLLSVLANRSGMIGSAQQLAKLGDKFGDNPVCVGPFSFVSRPSADRIELKKSDDYYDKAAVKLDTVTFEVITQPNVRASNLRSGDIGAAIDVAPADVPQLKGSSNVRIQQPVSLGYQLLTINVSNSNGAATPPFTPVSSPLANADLRKAFELTLDREAINKVVFSGLEVPSCNPISPTSPFYTDVPCSKPDIPQAKELVARSGKGGTVPVTLMIQAANDQAARLGTLIQSMAKPAGFDVKIQATENATSGKKAAAGDYDVYLNSWSGRIDPDQNMRVFWSPKSAINYSGADYPDVNALMEKGRTTTDPAARKEIYAQLVRAENEHRNYLVLLHDRLIMGVISKVQGINYYGDGVIRLKTAGFSSGG